MKINNHFILFKALVGSHSYGTNIPGSDLDYKGIFIQSPEDVLINGYLPQLEVNKDEVYFELGRFLELCESANPSVLELLYTPEDCIIYQHDLWKQILNVRQKFITKKCRYSFGGYAIAQIRKATGLSKKINWESEKKIRKRLMEFCYLHIKGKSVPFIKWLIENKIKQKHLALIKLENMRDCYSMYHVPNLKVNGIVSSNESNDIVLSKLPKEITDNETPYLFYFNKDAYSIHCREYKEYSDWLKNRNVLRYTNLEEHGQLIDGKNLLHCVRLLEVALEIPVDKRINVRRPNADFLKNIRFGKYNLKSIISACESKIESLDSAFNDSDLPLFYDREEVKKLEIGIRQEFYNLKNKQDVAY